jgi:hypothetical protein
MIATPVRAPLPTVAALLDPAHLGRLAGQHVARVERRPLAHVDGFSEASLERIVITQAGGGVCSFVLKRFAYADDWVMRATGDRQGRAFAAWACGLLERLPAAIEHAVVACAHDGAGWALLMHDVGRALVPPGDTPITAGEEEQLLAHMAAMHATFWEQRRWVHPGLGFCSLRQRYTAFAPATLQRADLRARAIPRMALHGWGLLEDAVDPKVAAVVRPLLADPAPLCAALRAYPQTVIHGDWKLGNLGLTDGCPAPRTVLLDWAIVGLAPPAVDLAWYLAVNSARLPITREATIDTYMRCLRDVLGDRFARSWWEPQLDLALLGAFLQIGWSKVLGARSEDPAVHAREQDEVRWWSECVPRGARCLERTEVCPQGVF